MVHFLCYIGFGVFTKTTFKKNSFLLEYNGTLMPGDEGEKLECIHEDKNEGCFIYYFEHKKDIWW